MRFLLSAAVICVVSTAAPAIAQIGPYSYCNDDGQTYDSNPYDAPVIKGSDRIVGWATTVVDYSPAPGVGTYTNFMTGEPDPTVGWKAPVTGVGSLGDLYSPDDPPESGAIPPYSGATLPFNPNYDPIDEAIADTSDEYGFIGYDDVGTITVGFDSAITNGAGHDFAVFENGFYSDYWGDGGVFVELAYVEVSTNGTDFARFESASLHDSYEGPHAMAAVDESGIYNLAGKHIDGWGTPFDLAELVNNELVLSGVVDLSEVNYVRLVDIPGSGDYLDTATQLIDPATGEYYTESHPIIDGWVTQDSGGFDFRLSEGVGVLNTVPEPGSIVMLVSILFAAAVAYRSSARRSPRS